MKKISFSQFTKFKEQNRNSSWVKAAFATLIISLIIYVGFSIYLFVRPVPDEIKAIIDSEVTSSDIKFDKKTLKILKDRQNPNTNIASPAGKNPFAPY